MIGFLLTCGAFIAAIQIREFAYKYAPASEEEKNSAFRGGDHPLIDGYDDFYDRKILNDEKYYHDDHSIF